MFVYKFREKPYPYTRVRHTLDGVVYTPPKYNEYKKRIAFEARRQLKENGYRLLVGDVRIGCLHFSFTPPKSWSNKQKELAIKGEIGHTSKPDLDNLVKGLLDALNGIVFIDDKNITTKYEVKKYYGIEEGIYLAIYDI